MSNTFQLNVRFITAVIAFLLRPTPCLAADLDSYQFLEGQVLGSPLYHISLHIHFKDPYFGASKDWYIGGLSFFRRNQIRGPITADSLKIDHPAKVLGVEEKELGQPKIIDHKLAAALVDSSVFLKPWLLEKQYPYSGFPIRGVGLNSNSVVRAILVKNNAYQLWSDLNYKHIAPGMGRNDPGIPGFDETPSKFPMLGEFLFWGLVSFFAALSIKTATSVRRRLKK